MKETRGKKYRIKSKFRFITFVVVIACMAVGIFGFASGLNTSVAITEPQNQQIEVAAGDTLWDIANDYKSNDTDTRYAVYQICKANDISAEDLQAGMVITIPDSI